MRLTILKDTATAGRFYKAGQHADVQPLLAAKLIEMGAAAEFGTVPIEVPGDLPSGANLEIWEGMKNREVAEVPEPESEEPQAEAVLDVATEAAEAEEEATRDEKVEEEAKPERPKPSARKK